MNKKFSTLVAAILAAGAWTTLDAKVVGLTQPVAGSYFIGTEIASGGLGLNGLLGANGQTSDDTEIDGSETQWVLEDADEAGVYYLKVNVGGTDSYLTLSNTGSSVACALTEVGAISAPITKAEFTLNNGNLKLANKDDFGSNDGVKALTDPCLKLNAASLPEVVAQAGSPSTIVFGVYGADDVFPGLGEVTVDKDGKVNNLNIFLEKAKEGTVTASFYLQDTNNKYLYVDGDAVKTAEKAEATAAYSWKLDASGKLVSVAKERAKATAKFLSFEAGQPGAAGTWKLADAGVKATVDEATLKVNDGVIKTVSVSALAPVAADKITAQVNSDGGQSLALQTSFSKDEYYFIAGAADKAWKGNDDGTVTVDDPSSSIAYDDAAKNGTDALDAYLWKIVDTSANGLTRYQFKNKKTGLVADLNGVIDFIASNAYNGGMLLAKEKGQYLNEDLGVAGNDDAVSFGIYKSPKVTMSAAALNALLGEGFGMTISQDDAEIEGMDAFNGKLKAEKVSAGKYRLLNGDKYVALKNGANDWDIENVGDQGRGDKFYLIDKDLQSEDADEWKNYLTEFTFTRYAGVDAKVVDKASVSDGTTTKELFVMKLGEDKYVLTATKGAIATDEKYPTIVLELSNIVNVSVEGMLGKYWNIDFALTAKEVTEKGEDYAKDNRYKVGGALAMLDGDAEFVPASSVRDTFPEAQWFIAPVADAENSLTQFSLMNRESGEVITDIILRKYINEAGAIVPNEYIVEGVDDNMPLTKGDKLKFSEWEATEFDGYLSGLTANYLRNNKFYMGQKHAIAGNNNVYFAENHGDSHKLGVVTDKEGAAVLWNIEFAETTKDNNIIPDTLKIERHFAKVNEDGTGLVAAAGKDDKKAVLNILKYQFKNRSNNEYIGYRASGFDFYVLGKEDTKNGYTKAQGEDFALKMQPDGTYNIIQLGETTVEDYSYANSSKVRVANSEVDGFGELINMGMYETDDNSIMVIEKYEAPEYHKITNHVWGDTITLARADNKDEMVYEQFSKDATTIVKDTTSFLNIENINDPKFSKMNAAIFADTAYIDRGEGLDANTCYQYLLAVRQSYGYHKENCNNPSHPATESNQIDTVYGDFLVNLIDTANVWGSNNIHVNPYIDRNEAGEDYAKLSFVSGFHTNDTLYIVKADNDTIKLGMDTPDFNVAKFAFRYVDESATTFKIQTQWKRYLGGNGHYKTAADFAEHYAETPADLSNDGYLKWINGSLVVVDDFDKGDVFTISEGVDQKPVANESIDATSEVSVVATNGAVVVKGAEGKNVVITNVLGQQVANTVASSNEVTISAPAGIVVVAVEGEAAIKAIVK
ncbi:DUF6383 domain-containing protein [Parabacteroides timonensis]|uniref:DUF6383 domain-containing protein n=1 Tax=Parabacteroides timonensis TaxID=1871013 RepID=UPI00094E577A|nr:DUF6383 domain-containing protein [Parabacteroides timonensis]